MEQFNIYNYTMNDKELYHCTEIAKAVNDFVGSEQIFIGVPPTTTDFVEGYVAGSIMCVEKECGFDYYFFTVSERGCVNCEQFNDTWMPKTYQEQYGHIRLPQLFVLYLFLSVRLSLREELSFKIAIHNGYVVSSSLCDNGKYRLTPLLITSSSGMGADLVFEAVGYEEPIWDKIECPACRSVFFHCDRGCPDGAMYEITCPNMTCGMLLKRKKNS